MNVVGEEVFVKVERDFRKENIGWLSLTLIMVAFPTLFFLCVFFPIWIGMTPRW